MPGSTLSVFGEPDDLQAALKEAGCVDLTVTGQGKFRARLSLIALHRTRLAMGEERQSRVAHFSIPLRCVRVTLPTQPQGSLVCNGTALRPGEIVTHSAGLRFHERTNGPCRWATMLVRTNDLVTLGHAMSRSRLALQPGDCRWQPTPDALRSLIDLHRDAFAATTACPGLPVDDQAAHGLEQQLLEALIECLVGVPTDCANPAKRQRAEIMILFEEVVRSSPSGPPPLAEIRAALGVSDRTLRMCCHAHLGMGPGRYLYLHRMRSANRELRNADHTEASVAQIARLHGFDGRGSFPKAYRALFGEAPSVTLRRPTTR
jgi:AraC-like DNA-binding protein